MARHGVSAGCAAEVSATTTRVSATAAAMSLGKGDAPGTESQGGQTGKYEGRSKRSGSFHDITQ